MASQIPDPRTLESWEDAFQHPLPVVRRLEQQLRKNIDDNRQKLRSLVGASYRDLLGTAERIIEMDQQMETVETYLGDIGRKCNARTVEKIGANHTQMRKALGAWDENKYKTIAQTKLLQSALTMVSRIIKAGGDALQASKLLVLLRLLYKSISEGSHTGLILDDLRRKLATQRRRLLSYIEKTMAKPTTDKAMQANTLSAFALVTSSTPKEVLRHFLQVRFDQLQSKSDSASETHVLQMLDLYSQTLLDTHDLFPRRFADSLSLLAKGPLLQDDQLRSIFELNLDIYGMWISQDVMTFIPWVRYDAVTTSEVLDALGSWAKQGQECILLAVQDCLKDQPDVHAVASIRQRVLSKYMSLGSRLRNEAQSEAIHDLRESFLKRLEELIVQAANIDGLVLGESDVANLLPLDTHQQDVWSLATEDIDLSNGALIFRRSMVQRRHQRNRSLQAKCDKLDEWTRRINDILDLADEMRLNRWNSEQDFDIEDLDDGDTLLQNLSKEDPERLKIRLRQAVEDSLDNISARISYSSTTTNYPAAFVRIWREVEQRSRALEARLALAKREPSLADLHQNLARLVSQRAIDAYLRESEITISPSTTLWDGSPPLPIQPSPLVFRFLKTLHQAMSDVGSDLWSPQAVFEMKGSIVDTLSKQLEQASIDPKIEGAILTNGDAGNDKHIEDNIADVNGLQRDNDTERNRLLQKLFDLHYLRRVFHYPKIDKPGLENLDHVAKDLQKHLELEEVSNERLKRSAGEYWKRTYLLFGLLASNSD